MAAKPATRKALKRATTGRTKPEGIMLNVEAATKEAVQTHGAPKGDNHTGGRRYAGGAGRRGIHMRDMLRDHPKSAVRVPPKSQGLPFTGATSRGQAGKKFEL